MTGVTADAQADGLLTMLASGTIVMAAAAALAVVVVPVAEPKYSNG